MTEWPPGFIRSEELVSKHGVDAVRKDLYHGRRTAFAWNRALEDLREISPSEWGDPASAASLQMGLWPDWDGFARLWLILIRDPTNAEPKVAPKLLPSSSATDATSVPELVALQLRAVEHFKIGPKQAWPKKAVLEQFFRDQALPDGTKLSRSQARALATAVRPVAAMRGGNKR
jgi:hypothetical protein